MTSKPRMEFGYSAPPGDRKLETIRPREFLGDLQRTLDFAVQHFSSIWVSDHFNYADEFRLECWTVLNWIAARYPGPMLSTIVMCNSWRNPALMAKMASSLQHLSSGRFVLGYGAGWSKPEYDAYGFDFPPFKTRIEMLEEGVQIIKGLWTEAPFTFKGEHYTILDAYCEPKPDPLPPILIGGAGERYTLRAVARHADWWNDLCRPLDDLKRKLAVLKEHCDAEGTDFDSIRKTVAPILYIDRSHSRAQELAGDRVEGPIPIMAGDPSYVRDRFEELVELGFDLSIVAFRGLGDHDDVKLFVDEVMPAFA